MRILLISPSPLNAGEWTIPYLDLRKNMPALGVLFLKEVIKQDHEVKLLLYDHETNNVQEIVKEAAKSDVTGFSLINFFQYPATREIIGRIKQEEIDTTVVLGGLFPIYHAQYLCRDGTDVVVNGEGEITFPHLLEALESGKNLNYVHGITYGNGSTATTTGTSPFADIEEIPLPCYDDLPLTDADYKYIPCETSRGCPNNCSFCGIYPHGNWRAYSPEKALASMKHAYNYIKYVKVPHVFLTDSNFTANLKRIKQMAALTDDEIPAYSPARIDHINESAAGYLQDIGVKEVFVGIESASENTLKNIRKNLDVNATEKILHLLIDYDITPRLSFIIGLPGETRESVIYTLQYMKHTIKMFGENLNVVLFPYRQDVAAKSADFQRYTAMETVADALVPHQNQTFRKWVFSLVYLMNTYHNTLPLEEQIAAFDNLTKSSPRDTLELAKTYDGEHRSWLTGYRKYFRDQIGS
jgi:anaerobic magnesium-protoporphyrin IX monomethyl ester cyclase